jgi:DNA-binding response OmpR family regulator
MKKTMLVVDDDELILLFSSKYFGSSSLKVLTAKHGAEAVNVLKSANVDLVLTDLRMPVMDGFELLNYIGEKHPGIHTIAMTGLMSSHVNERVRELGVKHCIEKPFKFSVLDKKIAQLLSYNSGKPEKSYSAKQDNISVDNYKFQNLTR